MAKSKLKLEARELRYSGASIRDIAIQLKIPKSTISLWCRDIELTKRQLQKLMNSKQGAIHRGQINGALTQKRKRLEKISLYEKAGLEKFKALSRNEFFVAGLALYLAEGDKKSRRIDFVNSDEKLIKFMIRWFCEFFEVKNNDFVCSVLINKIHRNRNKVIKKYWSNHLHVPLSQFRETIFVESKQHKTYSNHANYYGTFRLRVSKSTDLSYRILGLIKGLLAAKAI